MARYWAEIGAGNIVQRVVVSETVEWLVENLGGTWVETFPDGAPPVKYAGKGYGYDPRYGERFAAPWQQPATGSGFDSGDVTFHAGHMWRSFAGSNTTTPGVGNSWRDRP